MPDPPDDPRRPLLQQLIFGFFPSPSFARLGVVMSDLNMLLNTGGRERTEDEFASLLRAAGFKLGAVVRVKQPFENAVIEGVW